VKQLLGSSFTAGVVDCACRLNDTRRISITEMLRKTVFMYTVLV
jgi:hypothetical protein